MVKCVCVTNKFENFTYGKIYKGKPIYSCLDIEDDKGELCLPSMFGKDNKGQIVEYFIPLKTWRQRQLNTIIDEFKK